MTIDQEKLIGKKAYEIAYALFRISGNLSTQILGRYIENHCLSLFDSAIYGNAATLAQESRIIEYYLRLGGDLGFLHQDNVAVLILEIGKLNSIVDSLPKFEGPEPIKLHFSQAEPKVTADIQKMVRPAHHEMEVPPEVINREIEAIANDESTYPADRPVSTEGGLASPIGASGNHNNIERPVQSVGQPTPSAGQPARLQMNGIELRQSARHAAIMNKIRQLPDCRMKDMQESFPAVSERTLRYDLEKLTERGLIERVGPGGPATSYRIKIESRTQNLESRIMQKA